MTQQITKKAKIEALARAGIRPAKLRTARFRVCPTPCRRVWWRLRDRFGLSFSSIRATRHNDPVPLNVCTYHEDRMHKIAAAPAQSTCSYCQPG
jgi:hypothetical protein